MKKSVLLLLQCLLIASAATVYARTPAPESATLVEIVTNKGKIKVRLYDDTPLHRDNFIKLVRAGQFDGLLFHRVIRQFMIQAGDINSKNAPVDTLLGDGDLDYTIPPEILYPKYFHRRGQLCAARTGDDLNPGRESSATQFYIVTGKYFTDRELDKMEEEKQVKFTPEQRTAYKFEGGAPHLDGAYTVFGEVVKGQATVEKIQFVTTNEHDRPLKNVRIKSARIVKK
jgi:peptidylprolyl isomerase/peptidyl-prolyl cis-trans isomerase B (cyclophilin B)